MKVAAKSTRHRAREYALQGLYQWLLAGGSAQEICVQLRDDKNFGQADDELFGRLLTGSIAEMPALNELVQPHLDRPLVELTPIERAILLLGAYELKSELATPYRVIVNEAIELAKTFGGTEGHRFVNGVLDKLAPLCRPDEVTARREAR
jgi:transcription antitermination protein NusB